MNQVIFLLGKLPARGTWQRWVLATFVVAISLIITGLLWPKPVSYQIPAVPAVSTFTYEGVTWDCGQVETWNQQYGAYIPDGTRIPEYVVLHCDMNP